MDESGDSADQQFILFDQPVVNTGDLVTWVNGNVVIKARPTLTVPSVKVALPFLAERFSYIQGTGHRDGVESVPGLWAEHAQNWPLGTGVGAEIPFSDGDTAAVKAAVIATSLLNRQFTYVNGSAVNHIAPDVNGNFAAGVQLSGVIDRVTIGYSPSGLTENVTLTNEHGRSNFIPSREMDRRNREKDLVPGQAELRSEANHSRLVAAGLGQDPRLQKTLTQVLSGFPGIAATGTVTLNNNPT